MHRPRLDALVAVVVGVLGCAYRFLAHTSFSNDQFVHLARAQAWLAGDWPIRDYTEPGAILTVGISAAAQALFGQSLLPELLLSVAALGTGAAITYWVVIRLTSNRALGILAAALQIVIVPRLVLRIRRSCCIRSGSCSSRDTANIRRWLRLSAAVSVGDRRLPDSTRPRPLRRRGDRRDARGRALARWGHTGGASDRDVHCTRRRVSAAVPDLRAGEPRTVDISATRTGDLPG